MFVLVFIITILILVLIHEFGHFFAAKKFGIKILEFGFGLPPRAIGKKIGETIYSLNWLPFGGFVRLLGEDEVDKKVLEDKHSFAYQHIAKRITVVVAGVVMNLVLAWVLFWIVLASQNFKSQIPLFIPHQFIGVNQVNEEMILLGNVLQNSPAEKGGLKEGDRIIAFNDEPILDSDMFIKLTKQNAGKEIKLTISDPQKKEFREVRIVPRKDPPRGEGALGISLGSITIANLEYRESWQKTLAGPIHGYNLMDFSLRFLGRTIVSSFEKRDLAPVSENVAGPLRIGQIVKDILASKNPLLPYLEFMAMLSLNLAVVNVLPIPAVDGGRLFFLLIEAVTRKKVPAKLESKIHTIGFVALLGLIILITISDVRKIFF